MALLGSNEDLSIALVQTAGEVRLKTEGGLSDLGMGEAAVVAGDLTLEAGRNAIGREDQAFRFDLAENARFSARSGQDIRIDAGADSVGVGEILTYQDIHLASGGSIFDYDNDQEFDLQAQGFHLEVTGDIGGRAAGGGSNALTGALALAGREGALDIRPRGEGAVSVATDNGIVNLYVTGGNGNLGTITATEGVAIYADSAVVVGGDIRVDNTGVNMGMLLEVAGDISVAKNVRLGNQGQGMTRVSSIEGGISMAGGAEVSNQGGGY